MIVAMPLAIPVTRLHGLGDLDADFNALSTRADRVYEAAGNVLRQPFVGGALKTLAEQVKDRAGRAADDAGAASRTPDEYQRLSREVADVEALFAHEIQPKVRRNGILVALGITFLAGGGAYLIWKKG